jgi:uncharacterized membrane protein
MIEAHALDAWTHPSARTGSGFGIAALLGGFAAPLFLWLAGMSAVLSASSTARRTGSRRIARDRVLSRGLEIFILAFLFRLQAFVVSPGSHPITLFRVDILNILGPAIAASALVWGLLISVPALVATYGALSLALSMLTPLVRDSSIVDALPVWMGWYIRPAGEHTTFTAFPWVGFVFAGAACGVLLSAASDGKVQRSLHVALALAGLGLFGLGFYTASLPSIYPQSSFWTSSPTYFAIRIGILMVVFSGMCALASSLGRAPRVLGLLGLFGRRSLFLYWIHVELVYGYATWVIHRRLPLWGSAVAYLAFCTLMYGAVRLRDAIVKAWHRRGALQLPLPNDRANNRFVLPADRARSPRHDVARPRNSLRSAEAPELIR